MPLSLGAARVTAVLERRRPRADRGRRRACVAYLRLTGPVEEGDDVLVNVQARELGLGPAGSTSCTRTSLVGSSCRPSRGRT